MPVKDDTKFMLSATDHHRLLLHMLLLKALYVFSSSIIAFSFRFAFILLSIFVDEKVNYYITQAL